MQEGMPWRSERLQLEKKRKKNDHPLLKLCLCAGIGAIATYSGLQVVADVAETTYQPVEVRATPLAAREPDQQEDDFIHVQLAEEPDALPTAEVMPDFVRDGQQVRSVTHYGETVVVGLDSPIESREALDEIERDFMRMTFRGFPEELFNPTTEDMGQQIQDIRFENWRKIGDDYERTLEFVVSEETLERLREEYGVEDPLAMLLAHADAINEIWDNSSPDIHRQAVMRRIVIVSGDVLSAEGGGWNVVNDISFGWWANDTLNGVPGFIPYDIDSRWALDERWVDLYPYFGEFNGTAVDYGLLHELTHHLPVGDNHVYPPGSGHGFSIEQPLGKTAIFGIYELAFMHNDHMAGPGSRQLTAPSSYHILEFWRLNPEYRRTAQMNPYPVRQEMYGNLFYDRLTLLLEGLADAGIEGCTYMRQNLDDRPEDRPFSVEPSDEHAGIEFTGDACIVSLDWQHQADTWPGAYIGLEKDGIVFPFYIPRVLMETLYWKEALYREEMPGEYTFTISFTPYFSEALEQYAERIRFGEGDVRVMNPHSLWMYMDTLSEEELPESAIAHGLIDAFESRYIIEYRTEQ